MQTATALSPVTLPAPTTRTRGCLAPAMFAASGCGYEHYTRCNRSTARPVTPSW